MRERDPRLRRLQVPLIGGALIAIHYAIFSRFLPHADGSMGPDYSYFLPQLLDGYFWHRENGLFTVPWFTPAFCGGMVKFPNPQASYYSAPQFFAFLTDPVTSIRLTLITFATIGFSGFHLLLRRVFRLSVPAALLGATLFLFNGLYAHRVIFGHLTFHSFMLLPFVCLFLLDSRRWDDADGRWKSSRDVVCAGIALAYMAVTAAPHVLLQSLAAVLAVGFIAGILRGTGFSIRRFTVKLAAAGLCALCLSAAKLTAMAAQLSQFPRRLYPLPGVATLSDLLSMFANTLFWTPDPKLTTHVVANSRWVLSREEFDFGVTVVPVLLLALAVVSSWRTWCSRRFWRSIRPDQWGYGAGCALLLAAPIALNYYAPAWNALLKSLPILGNSVALFRWISLYIPISILLAAVVADRWKVAFPGPRLIAALGIVAVVALNATADRGFYHENRHGYSPRAVLDAYARVRAGEWRPSITRIAAGLDTGKGGERLGARNDALTVGASQLRCYETLYGFRLEAFPNRSMRPGPVLQASSDELNLMDPACLVFPRENHCAPGDRFPIGRRDAAEAFLRYQPFPFELPLYQRLSNAVSLVALAGAAAFLIACSARGLLSRPWSQDG